jgi:hypothetical protein
MKDGTRSENKRDSMEGADMVAGVEEAENG